MQFHHALFCILLLYLHLEALLPLVGLCVCEGDGVSIGTSRWLLYGFAVPLMPCCPPLSCVLIMISRPLRQPHIEEVVGTDVSSASHTNDHQSGQQHLPSYVRRHMERQSRYGSSGSNGVAH